MASKSSASQTRERFITPEPFDASVLVYDPHAEREERVDGATSDDLSSYRERTKHTPDFPDSEVVVLTALFLHDAVHAKGKELDAALDAGKRSGAPRKSKGFEILAHEIATWLYGSGRAVDDMLRNRDIWLAIRRDSKAAWPDISERWASPTPVNRKRCSHFIDRALGTDEAAVELKEWCCDIVAEIAVATGMADPDGGRASTPTIATTAVGDKTRIHSLVNRTADDRYDIDRTTGEILRERRHDPDANRFNDKAKKAGQDLVSLTLRNPFPHESLVLDFDFVPPGRRDEGEAFMALARSAIFRLPGIQAFAYDMALTDAQINDILRMGRHALVKVPRIVGNRPAAAHLGRVTFKHPKKASKSRDLDVDAVDGCPVIVIDVEGTTWAVPLVRISTIFRPRANDVWAVYGEWAIPDYPQVPASWVGLRGLIRHDSDPDETIPRTRACRPIPENDPAWPGVFGNRNSIESMHAHMKNALPGRRSRTIGQRRRTINHCGYMLSRAVSTLLAHHRRTGADLERWFGQWKPPDPRWWLSEEAA